ncbi:MAG TPA: hypothetical protein VLL98_03985 [Rickettsiales bacterium]|nr:hypothetical protein [Rickettsiales bacterium]
MKKLFCLLFLVLISCTTNLNNCCFIERGFEFDISSSDLSKTNKKIILDNLINNSSIKYEKNSNLKIVLNIATRRNSSLVSLNNSTLIENINFITEYKIFDDKKLIKEGKIIVVDDLNTYDNRFANYAIDNYVLENFARNLTNKLESKIALLLKENQKNCNKLNI